uniref:Uncharacterized protein n=1 Tax=Kalanchoe fedtschenkoi TaxID=63787 RepID=A0A7N0VJR9_KALFE
MSLENACERHRGEAGQPGICPSCLREKLAQLTADRSRAVGIGIGICSDSSPRTSCHLRHGSDVERSAPDLAGAVGEALRKSNSMTMASGEGERRLQKKKKKGFWSRLTKLTWQ